MSRVGNIIDRMIATISPEAGLRRMEARSVMEAMNLILGQPGGFEAGRPDRLTGAFANLNANAIDQSQLERMTGNSRDLWRNNPHARKVVRQIQTKTIGLGMRPIPQAKTADGKPYFAFRKRAAEIWNRFLYQSDSRGFPGKGGQHFTDQAKTALGAVVRGGNVLYRTKRLSKSQQKAKNLLLPLQIQLIDADRLDNSITEHGNNEIFRGVELNEDGSVAAYHILPRHPSETRFGLKTTESTRIEASQIGHMFVSEDIDEVTGSSWFASAMSHVRDVGDYTYNELKAAAMAACVVAGIKGRRGGPGSSPIGAKGAGSSVDNHGNAVTRLRPGMFLNLGDNEEFFGFNPERPNPNAEGFTQHLLRIVSSAFPGIKGATLTGDYRGSSFSAERSADNEIWPEIEGVQLWWAAGFQQPIYEEVIIAAVLSGLFDDVITLGELLDRYDELMIANWQGPVPRSINPSDDREASQLGLKNGTTSVQVEASKEGKDAFEMVQDLQEYVAHIESTGLSEKVKEALILHAIGERTSPAPGQPAEPEKKPKSGRHRLEQALNMVN